MAATQSKKPFCTINKDLVNLKVFLFLVFLAIGGLCKFLPVHAKSFGFNDNEVRTILLVAPLISILGPLIAGPLADRWAARNGTAKHLRHMIAFCLVLAALFYALLLVVPTFKRSRYQDSDPIVSFGCDGEGSLIFQQQCVESKSCFHWDGIRRGELTLTNCTYTCQKPTEFENLYSPWHSKTVASTPQKSGEQDYDYDFSQSLEVTLDVQQNERNVFVEPPHICHISAENGQEVVDICHVYTQKDSKIKLDALLRGAINQENETHTAEWCNYPLDNFRCNIPPEQIKYMKRKRHDCKPMVECEIHKPFESDDNVLYDSQCTVIEGDPVLSFWLYLVFRALADTFLLATLTLIDTAIVIATREISSGRDDVGIQFAWGTIGWSIVYIATAASVNFTLPIIIGVICMAIAGILICFDSKTPLSPPEWWWHTKIGMLAIPLSAIRKYRPEIIAVGLVTVMLGIFWGISIVYGELFISYMSYSLEDQSSYPYPFELNESMFILAIFQPILLFIVIWNADRIVYYAGHSNIMICAFALYVLKFLSYYEIPSDLYWPTYIMFLLEPAMFGLIWVTLILYMRHLFPRRLIATGQSLPIIAHFGIGEFIGAAIGFGADVLFEVPFAEVFAALAITAGVVGVVYFLVYHLYLNPRCVPANQPPPPPSELQTHTNGSTPAAQNGTYSPLRVYHNDRGRKGHFRY